MAEVSHSGRRKPRPWTAQEQATLEVAAACGVPMVRIAKTLNRDRRVLQEHIGKGSRLELKEAKAKRNKNWYLENINRCKALNRVTSRNWYLANKNRRLEMCRIWRESNRQKVNDATRRHRQRLRIGRIFVQVTFADRQQRFAIWDNRCAYCGANGKMTVDHVFAVKHGGLDEPSNLVPACGTCNRSKNAKPVEDWYRAQPFFSETRWRKIQRHCPAAVTGQLSISIGA